jgi:hypothetical protein
VSQEDPSGISRLFVLVCFWLADPQVPLRIAGNGTILDTFLNLGMYEYL